MYREQRQSKEILNHMQDTAMLRALPTFCPFFLQDLQEVATINIHIC